METMLTIIILTVIATVGVFSLGLGIWAIVRLSRRVSNLEGLCETYRKEFDAIYREFEIINTNISNEIDNTHRRIDEVIDQNDRNLDRRFDKVYNKINELMSNRISVIED